MVRGFPVSKEKKRRIFEREDRDLHYEQILMEELDEHIEWKEINQPLTY